jgi:predicted NBD/HSP70 family sugar kinase
MSPAERLIAGLDIGGTKTLGVAVDEDGDVRASVRLQTVAGGHDRLLTTALATLSRLAEQAGVGPAEFAGIGVGVPGIVEPATGRVRNAINLGIDDVPVELGRHHTEATGSPVTVDNDVNAAALGTAATLPGPADLAYLSVGTGIAAGFVLDGRLRRGRRGLTGELGHIPIDASGPFCDCGQRGCLEAVASGPAIARRWTGGNGRPPAVAMADAAVAGDRAARRVLDDVAAHLALAVTLLALGVDPDLVVLGGGVAEAGDPLLEAVRTAVRRRPETAVVGAVDLAKRVVLVPGGVPVGAIGAACLAGATARSSAVLPGGTGATTIDRSAPG